MFKIFIVLLVVVLAVAAWFIYKKYSAKDKLKVPEPEEEEIAEDTH